MKPVSYTTRAMRERRKLPAKVQTRIDNALQRYARTGEGDVKRLSGTEGFRLRVGDYRALFTETEDAVEIRAVRHRKEAYR
jgi:mRNA interferase RelE/StbE